MKLIFAEYQIRNWHMSDAEKLAQYANNFKVWLNLRDGFPHPYSLENAREFINRVTDIPLQTVFAIAAEKEVIGGIGLGIRTDIHRFSAELGYWLAEPYWGQGIMTRAVTAFTAFAFDEFELSRIFAEPYPDNIASCRILEKAGFKFEGTLVKNAFKNGQYKDQQVYARTR